MPYCFNIEFDKNTEDKIKNIVKEIHDNKLGSIFYNLKSIPHMSLGVYHDLDIEKAKLLLKDFVDNLNSFNIFFSHTGNFIGEEGVIFIAPTVTKKLLALHFDFQEKFKEFDSEQVEYYKTNRWVPHCTLAMNIDHQLLGKTIDLVKSKFHGIEAKIESISLVEFRPVKNIVNFKIKN